MSHWRNDSGSPDAAGTLPPGDRGAGGLPVTGAIAVRTLAVAPTASTPAVARSAGANLALLDRARADHGVAGGDGAAGRGDHRVGVGRDRAARERHQERLARRERAAARLGDCPVGRVDAATGGRSRGQ
jgi:3-hydroxyisobutyrate dehydrogenase-like beta-hydroxyacid dehydrogenase